MTSGIEVPIFEAAAKAVIANASPKIMAAISKRAAKEVLKIRVQFTKTFQSHLSKTLERSAFIKTVISRDKPVKLEDIYVGLSLASDDKIGIPDSDIDPCLKGGSRSILSGTGGAGKTVLMKHLLNLSSENKRNVVPIFIELRNIEFDEGENLERCIFNEIVENLDGETFELFKVALEEGLFSIYLDGFDEIHPEEHDKALRYIRKFAQHYGETSILISTRPKTGVVTLRDFTVFHVEPLSKDQAISLIRKTEFDDVTKEKFLSSLNDGLYEKHSTLMSLPILVAMMLLAYRTYADIPDRMTVFYGQAFETLYSIHDSENKELFKRQHHAGLAPDVFKNVLQAFCYLSLSNHDIEFSETTLQSYIKRALSVAKVDVPVEKYKNDLIHNVCVLQPDGLSYVFVHRSFQEYFASIFAISYSGSRSFEIFDQIIDVSGSAVARMMLELDLIKTRKFWLLPKMEQFSKYLSGVSRRKLHNQISAFCKVIWVARYEEEHPVSFSLGAEGDSNYRIMELLAECTGRDLGFSRVVSRIKIPNEKDISNHVVPSEPKVARAQVPISDAGIFFDHDRFYKYSALGEKVIDSMEFKIALKDFRVDLDSAVSELQMDISGHSRLEDHELFS